MTVLNRMSVKARLRLLVVAASGVALLLAVIGFIVVDQLSVRRQVVRDLEIQGRIIADGSSVALSFEAVTEVTNMLGTLHVNPGIRFAAIYDSKGNYFASYAPQAGKRPPEKPPEVGVEFNSDGCVLTLPVLEIDKRVGTLVLESDLSVLRSRFQTYVAIAAGLLVLSLAVAMWLGPDLDLHCPSGSLDAPDAGNAFA